jgi:hypothetical protein
MLSKKDIRALYGRDAAISRKGAFILVHLDRPAAETIRRRTREFDPRQVFCADCPLCQMLKESGIVVFDDSIFADEDAEE